MADLEKARLAKASLIKLLNRPIWLRGIGLSCDKPRDYHIKVNVDAITDDTKRIIPTEIDNVSVVVEEIGSLVRQK